MFVSGASQYAMLTDNDTAEKADVVSADNKRRETYGNADKKRKKRV